MTLVSQTTQASSATALTGGCASCLGGGARRIQDPVQGVQVVQHERPAGAQRAVQPVRHVEQRAQRGERSSASARAPRPPQPPLQGANVACKDRHRPAENPPSLRDSTRCPLVICGRCVQGSGHEQALSGVSASPALLAIMTEAARCTGPPLSALRPDRCSASPSPPACLVLGCCMSCCPASSTRASLPRAGIHVNAACQH